MFNTLQIENSQMLNDLNKIKMIQNEGEKLR